MTSFGEEVTPLHGKQGIKTTEHAFFTETLNNKKFKLGDTLKKRSL